MAIESIKRVKCDRCKRYGELDTRTGSCHIEWGRMNNMGKVVVDIHVDLCEKCTGDFEIWLENAQSTRELTYREVMDEDDSAQTVPLTAGDLE